MERRNLINIIKEFQKKSYYGHDYDSYYNDDDDFDGYEDAFVADHRQKTIERLKQIYNRQRRGHLPLKKQSSTTMKKYSTEYINFLKQKLQKQASITRRNQLVGELTNAQPKSTMAVHGTVNPFNWLFGAKTTKAKSTPQLT